MIIYGHHLGTYSCGKIIKITKMADISKTLTMNMMIMKISKMIMITVTFYVIKLTPWLMEPGGSMPHSQGLSNNSYPELNQPNYPH